MTQIASFSKAGSKSATPAKLDKAVFGLENFSPQLVKDVYLAYLANGRVNLAQTKKRGEVSGGGRKPWRQKGTGRARAGSSRSPLWRGGGITFGPTGDENYRRKINLKAKHEALRQVLSLSAKENRIKVIDSFTSSDGKVKPTLQLLRKIGASGQVLLIVQTKDGLVDRATRNLPNLKAVQSTYLNVFDIMNADQIVIDKTALDTVSTWLGTKKVSNE